MSIDPVLAASIISGTFGVAVATIPKWLAARLKARENGALARHDHELRQLEIEADARVALWENQKEELGRLRERVVSLEEKEHVSFRRGLEYQAVFLAMEQDMRDLLDGLSAFKHTAELAHVERVARSLQAQVKMGLAIGRAS